MTHKVLSRTKELATTTGTGTFTLAGALAGFLAFSDGLTANGDTTYYMAVSGSEWEEGIGTRVSASTMSRSVIRSSNANAVVAFASAPTVFGTMPGSVMLGPAFSAYQTVAQTLVSATFVKINYTAEEYDTDGCYNTANSRFTPNVGGYYQLSASVSFTTVTTSNSLITIYKNGVEGKRGAQLNTQAYGYQVSALVYLNGSTDYAEAFFYGTPAMTTVPAQATVYFCGAMLRPG